jgi:hypothetical protein
LPDIDWSAVDTLRSQDAVLQLCKNGQNLLSACRIMEAGDWCGVVQGADRSTKPSHGFFTAPNDLDRSLDCRLDIDLLLRL